MKYIKPIIQVNLADACEFLAESNGCIIDPERINYLCPYDHSRCSEYNRWQRKEHGVTSLPSNIVAHERISAIGKAKCPWKDDCNKYSIYCRLTGNGKQR